LCRSWFKKRRIVNDLIFFFKDVMLDSSFFIFILWTYSISYIFICNSYSVLFNKSCIVRFTSFKVYLIFFCNFDFHYDSVMLYNIILMSVSLLWEDLYLIKKLQLKWLRYYTLQIVCIALNFSDSNLRRNDHKSINLNNCTAWFKLILVIYKFINNKNTAFM